MFLKTYIIGPVTISWSYLKSSKTLIFNFALGLVGATEAYSGFLRGMFTNDENFGLFMVLVASVGAVLRFVTDKPLASKVQDREDI